MKKNFAKVLALVAALAMIIGLMNLSVGAEAVEPAADNSPAIYVYQKTANSVVGVITGTQAWDQQTRKVVDQPVAQGSGVVIAEGGYVVTNNHVIADGDSYQILMPSGEKVDATLVGADPSTDIAVLKVESDAASELVPVEIGASSDLLIGSTVVAIGNPGGEVLSNTVTQGIVSALGRTNVSAGARNTTRAIDYIQHDAAINNGNSGGGLFNYKGQLVGINTLKYAGSSYSSVSFEGLGFAIPVETVYKNATDLIQYGKVQRAQMGIQAYEYSEDYGPEEPMSGYAPAGVYVGELIEGMPAEAAGLQQYDYIYAVNGVRVKNMMELTTELDKYSDGDTVTVQVVRYANINLKTYTMNNSYSYFFGGGSSSYEVFEVSGGYQTIDIDITLKVPEN
ncbi:MAG: trypsin-like peptidase domain-containing protein [Clostridia bacterium]|nr:trypsin-like peptidase domain-containing protein [Clostridia bacterium]